MSHTHHPRPPRTRTPRGHASDVAFHAKNALGCASKILGQPGSDPEIYERAKALRETLARVHEQALELRELATRKQRSDAA